MSKGNASRVNLLWKRIRGLIDGAQEGSLVRNSFYIMATTGVTSGLGYIYWIVAARTNSENAVGLVAALLALNNLISSLTNLGFGAALVQVLPHRPSGHAWSLTLNTAQLFVTTAGFLGALSTAGILLLFHDFANVTQNPVYLLAFIFSVPLLNLSLMQDAAFTAERVAGNMLVHNALFAIVKLVLLSIFLILPWQLSTAGDGLAIFGSWQISALFAVFVGWVLLKRIGRGYGFSAIRGAVSEARATLGDLLGHHLINMGSLVPVYLLPVLVTIQRSPAENAYFSTAWLLRSIYSMVSVAVSTALFAEGSYKKEEIFRKVRSSMLLIGGLLVPIILVFFALGSFALGIFGKTYADNGIALYNILVLSAVPDAITNVYITVLRVQKRLRDAALLNISMGVIAVILTWLFLPALGIVGAGWAWLIAECAGSLVVGIDLARLRWAHHASPIR